MPNHIVKDNQVHFRQGYALPVLTNLFTTLRALEIEVKDTGSRVYPYAVGISESEFLLVIQIIEEL